MRKRYHRKAQSARSAHCQRCGAASDTERHHLRKPRSLPENNTPEHLVDLCCNCHDIMHNMIKEVPVEARIVSAYGATCPQCHPGEIPRPLYVDFWRKTHPLRDEISVHWICGRGHHFASYPGLGLPRQTLGVARSDCE